MKKLLLAVVMLLCCAHLKSSAQLNLSYYPTQSIVALGSNPDRLLWADLRFETNTFFSNLNTEFDAMINLKRGERFNVYSGLGINVNPFYGMEDLPFTNGFLLHTGLRFKPLPKHQKLHIMFELSPYVNQYFDGGIVRTMLGVGYCF